MHPGSMIKLTSQYYIKDVLMIHLCVRLIMKTVLIVDSVNHQMPSNDEHDYLELVTEMDKASQETALDGMLGNKKETIPPILPPKSRALYDEEDIKREDALNKPERIQAIQEKQKVSLKTLYINVEASPDIPRRSPTVIRKSESIDIAAGEYESCDAFKQPISSEDQEEGQLMDGDNIGLSSNICPDVIVCIRGVPDSISKAKMSEYLEKKMSISEDFFKVIPGENGLVIVEFFKKIELGPLGIALKNEHEKLDFCVVNTPKSVIVSSSELILDVNELKNYFGNYKNLGKLSHITEMDYGMMDIEFDTEEAVYTICANLTHSITEKQVHVSPLYECRFGKVWHKEWHKQIILPTDIHLEKIDPMLASFIQSSNSAVSIFDRKLLHSNAKLSLGKNKNDISIECLLKPYSQGVNVKAKTWRKTAIETWEKSVNELISKKEIHVPEEHIKRIKKYRRQYEEKGIKEILVEFHENPHDFWIEIIGLAEKVKKVYECYLNVIKTCTQHIQLPFSQIERIQQEGLLHYLESKNNVVIENDFRQRQILIRGVQEDVVNSKQEIFSILQNRTTDTVFAYQKSTDKLSQEANSQDIVNKIQENTEEQNTYEHINPLEDERTYDEIVQVRFNFNILKGFFFIYHSRFKYLVLQHDVQILKNIVVNRKHRDGDSKMTCRHGTTINIVLGELGKQKADVLVCSTNSDLKLGISSVGRNLLQNGGDDLQLECDQKYPTGIASGDIAKINGGSLDCKCIYLGILRNWNEGQYQYAKTVSCINLECLAKSQLFFNLYPDSIRKRL
ncbi:hypothetical protein KUTeg_005554 [Tegillarca granosa]|uniref:Uncharacterized protein n=1 Tax=Tegillarca granosa TaxID=220873 RepID=A0ABQ9FN21_TEGGR|nr:hypothetical protein KUTeg_005554 [Tegillarca granosa]